MARRRWIAVCAMIGLISAPALAQDPNAGLNVSLPLKELKALLDKEKPEERAPVDFVFGAAAYELVVGDRSATLTGESEISLPNPRWVLIPLGAGTGATSITIDDKPASVTRKDGKLFAVLDAREKKSAKLKVVSQLPVRTQAEISSLNLPLIPAPIATLGARISPANVSVKAPELLALKVDAGAAGTTLTATLPQAEAVSIQWSPRDAKPARVTVQHFNHVVIDRGLIRYAATLQYDILRSPADQIVVRLPDGVELTRVASDHMNDYVVDENVKPRALTVQLKEPTQGALRLNVEYEMRLKDDQLKPTLAMLAPVDAAGESGFVGIEVRGNYEVTPSVDKADRIDVAQLPDLLWSEARSPLRFGYRFDKPGATFGVSLRPLQDLEVLIAMSDISEVSTTVTPEGKVITKLIMIVRNNQKSHLRVTLPEGSQLWSAFVDDRPVTPARDEKGEILLPLRKSEAIDPDDEDNYVNQRENRRKNEAQLARQQSQKMLRAIEEVDDVSDLKPYDVELVYVSPDVKLEQRGQIKLALPKVDIPVGRLAWAIFLPKQARVVDASGNIREVDAFSLPFRHFGEAGLAANKAQAMEKLAEAQQQLAQAAKSLDQAAMSAKAKGVLPVRIEIPIVGAIHRFEKMLTVDEMPSVELSYVKRD